MDIQLLKEYKNENSYPKIRERAKSIKVIEIYASKTGYSFKYKGTRNNPYLIRIQFINNIKCLCSCPYDFGGLCKHIVASIDYIINEVEKPILNKDLFGNNIPINKTQKVNEKIININLENHLITNSIIHQLKNSTQDYYSYYESKVTQIEKNKITTVYNDYNQFSQTFLYSPKTQTLEFNCRCRYKKNLCHHIIYAIEEIVEQFGAAVFDPNYINNGIQEFLKGYNLTLEDNYSKYFDFKLGLKGIEVTEKVKNIFPSLEQANQTLIPKLVPENKDSLHLLLQNKELKQENEFGIGFCLELTSISKKPLFYLLPFTAKHKKRSPEFVSLFNEIEGFNFINNLSDFNIKDKLMVIKALEFESANSFFIDNFNVERLRSAFIKFQEFLELSKNHLFFEKKNQNKLSKKNIKPITIKEDVPELFFTLTKNDDFYTLKAKLKIKDKNISIDSKSLKIYPYFCKIKENIYLFKDIQHYIFLDRFQNKGEINFFEKDYPKLYKEIIQPISEYFEVKTTVYKKSKEKITENELKKQIYLTDFEGEFILFKLAVQYKNQLVLLHSKEQLFNDKTQEITPRNTVFENEFLEEFSNLHPDFNEQENPFFLTPFQLIEDEWLLNTSEILKHKGIEVFGANDLKTFKYNLHKPTISMNVASNIDWFDLMIEIKFGKEIVSLKEVRKAIINKSKYILLKDGSYGILPKKWLKKLANYFKTGEVKKDSIKISNYQFNVIDELFDELEETPQFLLDLQKKKRSLQNLETSIKVKVPKNIKATLRPYQIEGLNWLIFLDKNNLGGCLADDMGLGKTLQVITFFSYLKSKKKGKNPHLVIAPTSVVFNWQREIEKFCPSLKVLIYTGPKRKNDFPNFKKYDVILSTYGSLLNDIEFLKDFEFNYVVLDESQAIKNPKSKRYKAVRLLKAKNRLALTGTPIENNTFDLYAQMNFLNPGLLGAMSHFKKEFSDAIDKAQDEQSSNLLSKIIHPFLLRRTKDQVATELPKKTETILYCEMGTEQRKVYESFKKKFRDYLLGKIEENGVAKSQMYVLEGLTKLRQICNSPELLNDKEDYGKESIKLDILIDNIRSKTANHKILVFSQFTSMLKLIKERLEEYHITYEYLDGRTRNREEKVQNFQENKSIRVFLISLKAGGVGLNLTAADYVFLVDPWWNPAVENQAIDRCYRIGQTKKVMAYKMICKNTIEEKITKLQNKKKQVSNSIIQVDKIKKSFNTKEIKDLFR